MTNILIIDANPAVTSLLESALAGDSCCVQTVRRGQAGLSLMAKQAFDVVIADIFMPDYDGFEVIMEINNMQPRPKVIAMTGWTGETNREYLTQIANNLSVQRLLFKPFSMVELLDTVFLNDQPVKLHDTTTEI
jgi:CheY-like chemotaxis protein